MLTKNILLAFALAAVGMGNPAEKRNGGKCSGNTDGYTSPMYCPDGSIGLIPINLCVGGKLSIRNFREIVCSLPQPDIVLGITVPACCDVVIGNCKV